MTLTDQDLLDGKAGELSGLLLVRRDMLRGKALRAEGVECRMDGFMRDAAEQAEWQKLAAEIYGDQGYVPTPSTPNEE